MQVKSSIDFWLMVLQVNTTAALLDITQDQLDTVNNNFTIKPPQLINKISSRWRKVLVVSCVLFAEHHVCMMSRWASEMLGDNTTRASSDCRLKRSRKLALIESRTTRERGRERDKRCKGCYIILYCFYLSAN